MNCFSSLALRLVTVLSCSATAAAATSTGSAAYKTFKVVSPRDASAAAYCNASRDCSEKSTAQSNDRKPRHGFGCMQPLLLSFAATRRVPSACCRAPAARRCHHHQQSVHCTHLRPIALQQRVIHDSNDSLT